MSSTRRAIPVTCTTHSGGTNFCNLLMTRETDGTIVFDPRFSTPSESGLDGRAPTSCTRRDTPCGWCSTAGYATLRSWHTTL